MVAMAHLFGRALEVVYSTSDIWVGLPYVCAAAGVFSGGLIVWWLVMWTVEYVALGSERASYLVSTGGRWGYPTTNSWRNAQHLFLMCIFFTGIVFIVWISATVAGLNPWTSAAATLTLGVIITYGFAGLLGHVSAAFTVLATNSVGVGQHWEFLGMPGYDGFIHCIDKVSVTITRYNEESGSTEIVYMPMSNFTNTPRKRNFKKEMDLNGSGIRNNKGEPTSKKRTSPKAMLSKIV